MQHKKIYKAFFKCRLCGEIFSTVTTENRIMATKIVSCVCTNTDSDIALAPDSKEVHMCKDGGIGMADFLGFNDVVTKTDKIEKAFKLSMDIPNVDVDIDSVTQKMQEKLLEELHQVLGMKEPHFYYQKIDISELDMLFERVLNGKNDFVAFYTENQKGYAPKLVICEKQDIEIIRNSLKNDPNIRVVSAGAFCNGVTLLEVHELLESDLKEIKE